MVVCYVTLNINNNNNNINQLTNKKNTLLTSQGNVFSIDVHASKMDKNCNENGSNLAHSPLLTEQPPPLLLQLENFSHKSE